MMADTVISSLMGLRLFYVCLSTQSEIKRNKKNRVMHGKTGEMLLSGKPLICFLLLLMLLLFFLCEKSKNLESTDYL